MNVLHVKVFISKNIASTLFVVHGLARRTITKEREQNEKESFYENPKRSRPRHRSQSRNWQSLCRETFSQRCQKSLRRREGPQNAHRRSSSRPSRVIPLQIDVTNVAQVKAAANQAKDVTLLINNAGVAAFGSILSNPQELVVRDIDTNYYGKLNMIRAFAPIIESNGGGGIANLLTIVALASMPGLGGYNASKAAAWSMTQSVRAELSKKGIEVYGVYPGAVDTDMIRAIEMPKTSPEDLASATLDGIEASQEDIFPDAMSQQFYTGWTRDHKALEHQFGAM